MVFVFDDRPPASPLVEMIWRTQSEQAGTFTSQAESRWEMVITKFNGTTNITVRGPETKATVADFPEDAEFFGIVFKLGTYMPHLPIIPLVGKGATLPEATRQSFYLHGSAWELPTFENADVFVERLVRQELVVRDPVVEAVLQNQPHDLSIRTVRRHFLRATGIPHSTIQQIQRAQQAVTLLKQGVSILDVVFELGYFDQPHMTKALKHYMGQTPAQILHQTE